MIEETNLFTEVEAAKLLRVSRITLQRTRLNGKIAFVRIGGSKVFYKQKHHDDYLLAQERKPYSRTVAAT